MEVEAKCPVFLRLGTKYWQVVKLESRRNHAVYMEEEDPGSGSEPVWMLCKKYFARDANYEAVSLLSSV